MQHYPSHISGITKTLRNILRFLVCTIIGAYVLLLAFLNFSPCQEALTQTVSDAIAEKTGAEVSIGSLQVGLFNRLIINDITIKDQNAKEFLQSQRITAKIELRSLLKKQISLRTVSLLDTQIKIYKSTAQGPSNIQFFIDALSSKSKKKSNLDLRINSLILRRVFFKYDEWYKAETPQTLNPSHLHFKDITANISIKKITPDSLNLRVRSFAFTEKSGLTLEKFSLNVRANRKKAFISDFKLEMPHTQIIQKKLEANYNAQKSWANILQTLSLHGSFHKSHIASQDFEFLHPKVSLFDLQCKLSTDFNVSPNKVQLSNLIIKDNNQQINLSADVLLQRQKGRISGIKYDLHHLEIQKDLAKDCVSMATQDTMLLHTIDRLGDIKLKSTGDYPLKGKKALAAELETPNGILNATAIGHDNDFKIKFSIADLHINQILGKPQFPSNIHAEGQVNTVFRKGKIGPTQGDLTFKEINWNQYNYKDIQLTAQYLGNQVSAQVKSSDANIKFDINGSAKILQKKLESLALNAQVENFHPIALGFNTKFENATFGGNIVVDYSKKGNTPYGQVCLKDFNMADSPHGDYHLDRLMVEMKKSGSNDHLQVRSDFLDADLLGNRPIPLIVQGCKNIIARSLPNLLKASTSKKEEDGQWKLQASLKSTDALKKLAGVNVGLKSPLFMHGVLDSGKGNSSISIYTDGFSVSNQDFAKSSIFIKGSGSKYQCLIKSGKEFSNKRIDLLADIQTVDSTLVTRLSWQGAYNDQYNGTFKGTTRFYPSKDYVNFKMDIHPSQFTLADTVWNIAASQLALNNRCLSIHNVGLSRVNQSLHVNGTFSPEKNDSIIAKLKNIDIEYILDLVNFHAVEFGGKATGDAIFKKGEKGPYLQADLQIPNFTFNNGPMGVTHLKGGWNSAENQIDLNAKMVLDGKGNHGTEVKGYVSLAKKELDLMILANETNLKFLRRYMDGIFDNFDGKATGYVNLYGPFKKLDFKGKLSAQAEAEIMATGVNYKVYDGEVVLSPGTFDFRHFKIKDKAQGEGTANGQLTHNHLKNLCYDFSVTANKLLCYDMPQSHDMPFYSTTTGSGKVHLVGFPGKFTADISLRPEAPTEFVYTLGTPEALSTDNEMIRFRKRPKNNELASRNDSIKDSQAANSNLEATTDITLNFLIDCTPAAKLKIITDPRAGDAITAYGSGPLRATFNNKGSFEMYGTYELNRGVYKLSLQDIIRKDLKLQKGSTITFTGNPMLANLGLKAIYTVNGVSLSDLNYGAGFSQKSVKVDCILNITGKAQNPQVNFDLDFHNISDDEKQMVRQLIATDEDLNRQVIYLLGIGRFYAANTQSSVGQHNTQEQSAAAMRSFLSTTLTSQLNNAISSALGSQSHWSFGTNLAPGTLGWEDLEVDGLLQGRLLNDRLLINGNFGYRDRPTYTSNFVGDFDIRYILTPKGSVSLRAYSETTDRYFTKSSMTTQGVGITVQREFNKFRDLFKWKRKKKKENAEEQK